MFQAVQRICLPLHPRP